MIIVGDIHAKIKEPFRYHICIFFKWLLDNYKNETIILLGDVMDSSSPHNDVFYEIAECLKKFDKIYIITGNHDYSKLKGNCLSIFNHFENVNILEQTTEIEIESNKCLFLPYKYSNIKEEYERLEGNYDYIFTHITPLECAFGDEGIDLKLKGTYIHGHTHIQKDFVDKYSNQHYVLGVPLITRHGEQNQNFRIVEIKNFNFKQLKVPIEFTYEEINYGDIPKSDKNIIKIKNAPSYEAVFEKYGKYYIDESKIELQNQIQDIETNFNIDITDLKKQFKNFAIENNLNENVVNKIYNYI